MSSYHTPYSTSAPSLFDSIKTSTLPSNDQPGMYLSSQVATPSPPYTSSTRVSKAMKGKRVHACERPGCHKVSSHKAIYCVVCSPVTRRYSPGPNTEEGMNSVTNRESNIHARMKDAKKHSIARIT